MKLSEKDLQGLLPNLKGLPGIDPRIEFRLTEAFRRVYEIMMLKLREQEKTFEDKISNLLKLNKNEIESLRSLLAQPLIGSSEHDTVLQTVISSYGPQSPNHFLAGPIPSFRAITSADLPPIIATKLDANGTILDINDIKEGEYLKRIADTIVSDLPTGTINLREGTLDDVEANLYTTPNDNKTKMRHILLFNNSAGALTATIKARNAANIQFYTNDFPLASLEKILITLNLELLEDYKLNGFTTVEGAIEYSLFGIEEPTI